MTHPNKKLKAALGALLLACGSFASAALVTSRAALGGDDFIDWAQLGAPATLTALGEPAAVTSDLGRSATVQNTGGDLYRFNEGDGTFGGNFTTGDALLFTLFDGGKIDIDFALATGRAGAQIQGGSGQAFRARIEAFAIGGALLEGWDLDGAAFSALSAGDGSNIFIGISRASNDIDRIAFSVSYADPLQTDLSVAINRLSFGPAATVPGGGGNVPIPATSALVLLGLGLVGVSRRPHRG